MPIFALKFPIRTMTYFIEAPTAQDARKILAVRESNLAWLEPCLAKCAAVNLSKESDFMFVDVPWLDTLAFNPGIEAYEPRIKEQAPQGRWLKLERHNEYGVQYLVPQGTPRSGTSRVLAVQFTAGQNIRVRWPDGTITDEVVGMRSEVVEVRDLKSFEVTSEMPCITRCINGITTWIPLESVEVWQG